MKTNISKFFQSKAIIKGLLYLLWLSGCFAAATAFADATTDSGIAGIAGRITSTASTLATMMIAVSYIAGIGFVVASLFKFKQHKDNPTQIPLGTPLALMAIGVILVFLPALFAPVGKSIFGSQANPAGKIPTSIDSNSTGGGGAGQ